VLVLLTVFSLCALTGLDLWISNKRWKAGAKDLNPVVQHFVKNHGTTVGSLSLAAINLIVIAAASLCLPGLLILLGAKIALAALQIRSIIENADSHSR
jgi:hypothetical protein